MHISSATTQVGPNIPQGYLQSYYLQVFQRLVDSFLELDLSPTFLNTGTTSKTFKESGKQDSFRHILKSSASMYETHINQYELVLILFFSQFVVFVLYPFFRIFHRVCCLCFVFFFQDISPSTCVTEAVGFSDLSVILVKLWKT